MTEKICADDYGKLGAKLGAHGIQATNPPAGVIAKPHWTPAALGDTARQSLSTLMIRAAVNAELADGHAQDAKFILSLIERAHIAGQAIDRDKLAAAWAHAKRARDAADVALGSLARMGIE